MNTALKRSPHPLMLTAGIALILFCAAGISAIMGWIPNSMGRETDKAAVAQSKPAAPTKSIATPNRVANAAKATCANCGVIQSVRAVETNGAGSGIGAIGGAVVGGLLGNQVGGGHGKQAMTVVGALGGALAGNEIEKNVRSTTGYDIVVRMENGSDQLVHVAGQSAWRSGDRVKVVNGVMHSA